MKPSRLAAAASVIAALCLNSTAQAAPEAADSELYRTVQQLDAQMFQAFNACDLKVMGEMVTDDLEFYHDRSGLDRGRGPFIESTRKYICGKVRRELIGLEVYPLANFGAVEMGTHRFCDVRRYNPCDPAKSGDARFAMIWQKTPGGWKLSRVISYDHVDRPD